VPFLDFIYHYLYFYPIYNPIGGVRVLEEAWDLLLGDVKDIFRIAESNLDVLNTVDLGPKRPFGVGECALCARLAGPQFAVQVGEVVSLAEAPANHRETTTVAKEVMAIEYSNKTSHTFRKFLLVTLRRRTPQAHSKGHQVGDGRVGSDSRRSRIRGQLGIDQAPGC
jgi:hypothetical protein